MYSFKNDYSEGAHPLILKALAESNMEQADGYSDDVYCREAAGLIRQRLLREDVAVHFFAGGTQTNLTALSAFLRPHEAAISASTGHIEVHETGAIEATGHKVIPMPSPDGKIYPAQVMEAVAAHTDEHMVKPRLVYISDSTEIGSVYVRAELEALSECCRQNNLILFMDGARLGSALCAESNDLDLAAIARLVDAFYIGGTKNGALIGEALVICTEALKADFRFHMKQKGALLAKGRLLGLQFRELFRDDLFFEVARHANRMAAVLRDGLAVAGFGFLTYSPSNQIFPILPNWLIAKLQADYAFYVWAKVDAEHSAIRLVTSWATPEARVREFLADMSRVLAERG